MSFDHIADYMWGKKSRLLYLLTMTILLLFSWLGSREIWTQEHRWADIVAGMFYRHDFLHPFLGQNNYYDKPLLSYWLIVLVVKLTGIFSSWSLRIPSALAGCLAIYSIYSLGKTLKDTSFGLLCGWLLLTTYYFVFWSRISSADMLNLAGTLFAVAWYFEKREQTNLFDYSIFFVILALTSLCKGLTGVVVPLMAVFVDLCLQRSWKKHIRLQLILAILPGLFLYILPFWMSTHFNNEAYQGNGLMLVWRENFLRYFKPFDHQGPLYTYFIYLPIYSLPWSLLILPAIYSAYRRWQTMAHYSKWIIWTLILLFLFFTMSGSRRSYYILPLVPYMILFLADYILTFRKYYNALVPTVLSFLVLLFLAVDVLPTWYYRQYGVEQFASYLQKEACKIKPWSQWNVVLLDAESKLNFYLSLPPDIKNYNYPGDRDQKNITQLKQIWPILINHPDNTIFISRKLYTAALSPFFSNYRYIELPRATRFSFLKNADDTPIGYIPQ